MGKILYYLILKPLGWLPLAALYPLSDLAYLIAYKILGYRKDVVFANLEKSFPQKTEQERRKIASKFYHYLMDLMVESIWYFGLTEKRVAKHLKVNNPELLNNIYDSGRGVILILGHYGSWELVLSSLNLFVQHQLSTIYIPLTNKTLDEVFLKMRKQFGSEMVAKKDFANSIKEANKNMQAIIFGADQSPSISKNIYWTNFLNQDTAVALGAEKYAKLYDMPVVFTFLNRERRGYYTVDFEIVSLNPRDEKEGVITERHVRLMEKQILAKPEFWLWSHKRWKKKRE